jgi:tRNA threonylcarbamoyladenosine biosynthesis protein TsaE
MPEAPRENTLRQSLATAEDTVRAGRDLAGALQAAALDQLTLVLIGDLGAGKTTFARGFLEALGHTGRVPSPTYTLVEPYELGALTVYHVDLYRLVDARDVDDLGLSDLLGAGSVLVVEWPERAGQRLPAPDLSVSLEWAAAGRVMTLSAGSPAGERLLVHKIVYKGL